LKERSVEKERKQGQEQLGLLHEIKELKQKISFFTGEMELKEREIVHAKKEQQKAETEQNKLLERNEQLNYLVKSKAVD